jgi:gentisate 1,2-dioxygenase
VTQQTFRFEDATHHLAKSPDVWPPLKVPGEAIQAEIQRLADMPMPTNGRRTSLVVHPRSTPPGLGISPGVDVTICVLKPGESTVPVRRNSSQVEMCIGGTGVVEVDDRHFSVTRWDVWNIPSMRRHRYRNTGAELMVRLSYSNQALLEKLGIHYVEENPAHSLGEVPQGKVAAFNRSTSPDIPILGDGARLRGYEFLTDIEVVENNALLWPWAETSKHVSLKVGDGQRTIMLLYNPATERRNGTSHSFFATIASIPEHRPVAPRGHRHSSVAINYHFRGRGRSVVDGQEFEWKAGDLMLSAPAWSEHAHGVDDATILTIQDHPLHIGMESLIWQESMTGPILTLGAEQGQTGYVGPRMAGS